MDVKSADYEEQHHNRDVDQISHNSCISFQLFDGCKLASGREEG